MPPSKPLRNALPTLCLALLLAPMAHAQKAGTNPKDGADMVYVPAGAFTMGSNSHKERKDLVPVHVVTLDGYWIYKNDVTVARYRAFCQATGRQMPDEPSFGWHDNHPIVNVSWNDAAAYAQWAGASLPTEAQWEKAARGTDARTYTWGNDLNADNLWSSIAGKVTGTMPVGSFPAGASPYGCLDMAGNVWQWCADWDAHDYYSVSPAHNPTGPSSGSYRIVRGGCWATTDPFDITVACRNGHYPGDYNQFWGFRCVVNQ